MISRLIAGTAALIFAVSATARPLVVILADPAGTVATDLLAPYAILAESGAVDVKVVSTTHAPVRLLPGMAWVAPQMTLAQLAQERPQGPDAVIVPALEKVDDAERASWLRAQFKRGTQVMSVCNGAKVLAAAGLLDGRQATIHWYSRGDVAKKYPQVAWRHDARWVTDGTVTTTAGISAAEPATLQLLARIAGQPAMQATAQRLGLPLPDPAHDGDDYRLTFRGASQVTINRAAFWGHEDVAVAMTPGMDERAFGVALEGWSRTYRSTAWAAGEPRVTSRHGLVFYRSRTVPAHFDRQAATPSGKPMEDTFEQIRGAYGNATARFVALQFEHPYGAISAW